MFPGLLFRIPLVIDAVRFGGVQVSDVGFNIRYREIEKPGGSTPRRKVGIRDHDPVLSGLILLHGVIPALNGHDVSGAKDLRIKTGESDPLGLFGFCRLSHGDLLGASHSVAASILWRSIAVKWGSAFPAGIHPGDLVFQG
jgi:hypothetical protein